MAIRDRMTEMQEDMKKAIVGKIGWNRIVAGTLAGTMLLALAGCAGELDDSNDQAGSTLNQLHSLFIMQTARRIHGRIR